MDKLNVKIDSHTKLHALFIPCPAQGHITPMFKLATLFYSKGFHVTFVNTEYNHRRLLRSGGYKCWAGLDSFRFETIPDGLPHSDADVTQDIPMLCDAIMTCFGTPFKELIGRLNCSDSGSPPITVIVSDGVMPVTLDAAREMCIPLVWFWTASVCGFVGYLQYPLLLDKGLVPFQASTFLTDGSLDKILDWVPSMPNIKLKYIPSFMRTTNKDDIMLNFLMISSKTVANSSSPIIVGPRPY